MTQNEIETIRAAQEGDTKAFDELVRIYDRQVFKIAYDITGNTHDAHDVFQETFLRAFSKISTFRFDSSFKTWLLRIAINLSKNHYKKQRLKKWFSLGSDYETPLCGMQNKENEEFADPDRQLESRETMTMIHNALAQLSENQRIVFVLKHMHGYKVKEIAEKTGYSEGTVKTHLFRGTRKLKNVLAEHFQSPHVSG